MESRPEIKFKFEVTGEVEIRMARVKTSRVEIAMLKTRSG